MPVHPEAVTNFQRAVVHDGLLGIVNLATNTLYLALATPMDGSAVNPERRSTIGGVVRDPLPGAGGHGQLAGWIGGMGAVQVAAGVANGNAFGFSLVKTGPTTFTIGTYRSGFNGQYAGARPGFAQGTPNQARTLEQDRILNTLLPLLTQGLLGAGRGRSLSF